MTTVRRQTVLEVRPGQGRAATVRGTARDEVLTDPAVRTADVDLTIEVAQDATIASLDYGRDGGALAPLVGLPSGSGFRRRLGALPRDTPELRLAHRLLDDLPILLRVSGQTSILAHPALARPPAGMDLAGADQCEGWRSDGTMLQQIAAEGGVLQMALTEPVDDTSEPWADAAPRTVLPPMATRRRRRVEVTGRDGALEVRADFRDSYADPDGLERGLHGYTVTARVGADGRVEAVDASGVVLPWPECWRAADSAGRLVGLSLDEVEQRVKEGLVGRGTCTHLSDTLRTLADVAELDRLATVR
jgi:hypothetical protein